MTEITLSDFLFVTGVIFFLIALVVILPTIIFDQFFEKEMTVQPIKEKTINKQL